MITVAQRSTYPRQRPGPSWHAAADRGRLSTPKRWFRGITASAAGAAVTEVVTAALGKRSFVDAAAQPVIDFVPRPVIEYAVWNLRAADKPLLRGAVLGVVLGAGALLGRAPRRIGPDVAVMGGVATAGVLASRRRPSDGGPVGALAAGIGGTIASVATLRAPTGWSRAAGAAAIVGLYGAPHWHASHRTNHNSAHATRPVRATHPLPPARDGADDWPGVSPLLTPVSDFYVTDTTMRQPVVDPTQWRLRITGEVDRPLTLSYDDLIDRDLSEFDATMVCIHNRVGWDRVGNQRWTGIPLTTLIAAAEPSESAALLVTKSVDGWECSLPLQLISDRDAFLVLGMGGRALTAGHGFPARVFVPGFFGQYSGAKWVTELRLQSGPNRDYWMARGWPQGPTTVQPLSRIDAPTHQSRHSPGPVTVTGVAWAPPVGVEGVQVAVDDHPWVDAEVAAELAPTSWRRWRATVSLPPGKHQITARCVAREEGPQDARPRLPFPTGATGHHRIVTLAT